MKSQKILSLKKKKKFSLKLLNNKDQKRRYFRKNKVKLPFNFTPFFSPGVYLIKNTRTNNCYIGEAKSLAYRLGHHYSQLKNKRHPCKALQKEWTKYGPKFFIFKILKMGRAFYSTDIRVRTQRFYARKYLTQCFNQIGLLAIESRPSANNQQRNSIPVIVRRRNYPSISAAADAHGVTLNMARNLLNDPANTEWVFADPSRRLVSNVARPVVINNVYYPSVSSAAAAQGCNEDALRSRIQTRDNWNYYDQLTPDQRIAIINQHEIVVTAGVFRQGRRVKVVENGQEIIYPSIIKTANAYNICSRSVRKRIKSLNFPGWSWADSD